MHLLFWTVPHRAHQFTFYSGIAIPLLLQRKSLGLKISFRVTHRVHFFLPRRVQLLFWMVHHRAHLFTFHSNVHIPHFAAVKIYSFKILFCVTHRVHFFLPYREQFMFSMVSICAHLFISYSNTLFLPHRVQLLFWMVSHSRTYLLILQMEEYPTLLHWHVPTSELCSVLSCKVLILSVATSNALTFFIFRWRITPVCIKK